MGMELVFDAIDAVYETPADVSLWPIALDKIARCFGCVGANLLTRRDDGTIAVVVSPALVEAKREWDAGWWQQDFPALRAIEQGYYARGNVLFDTDVASEDERRSHPYYADYRRRHGLGGMMAGSIAPAPTTTVGLVLQQPYGRKGIEPADVHLFERLLKHCERALLLSCRIESVHALNTTLIDLLAKLNCGVFQVDDSGRCRRSNAAAERLLGKGISLLAGRLWLRDEAARQELDAAVVSALRDTETDRLSCARPILARRGDGERPLVIYVVPLRSEQANQIWMPLGGASALVVVIDLSMAEVLDPSLVRDYLGLTLAEARVASHIGIGLSPRETSERLGISEETVRTALKRVFSRTGISRQAELAALLARLELIDIRSNEKA